MADQKISTMTPAGALTGAELVPAVQSGGNVRTSLADMAAYGNALITLSSLGASANGITLIGHTFAQMRADLDLEAGTDFVAYSAYSANALTLIGHTFAQMRTDLSLVPGTDIQAYSAKLAALAAQTWAADTITYQTSTSAVSTTALTAFGRSLIDDADAATARATLGLVIGTNVQAWDADLDTWATKTAPSGVAVGTTDTQTLTNKTLGLTSISGNLQFANGIYARFGVAGAAGDWYIGKPGTNDLVVYNNTTPIITLAGATSIVTYSGQVVHSYDATTKYNRAATAYLLELQIGGTTRGYIGADATKDFIVYDSGGGEDFSINNSTGIASFAAGLSTVGNVGFGVAAHTNWRQFCQSTANDTNAVFYSTHASLAYSIVFAQSARTADSAFSYFCGVSNDGGDTEFNLRGDGTGLCDGSWTGGGADYAEYFEWADGNPSNEDRRGLSVVLENEKIRPALAGEDPFGVITGNPSVVGDAAWSRWSGKYERDDFGGYVLEDYKTEEGEIQQRRKLNPDYDPKQKYTSREDRPEWSPVGLVGKLRLRKGEPTGSRWIKMRDISGSVEEWLVR